MASNFYAEDICPKCAKPIFQSNIDRHPSRPDLAIYNFRCADCGPVKSEIISLTPSKSAA
jgi:hypothetical protein